MAVQRLFGYKTDATVGGSSYDDLAAGLVPDADTFWPVTGGTLDKNTERIDRNDEVRGRRAAVPSLSFRGRPVMTIPVPAYRSVLEAAIAKTLGGTDTRTGVGPAAITHSWSSIDYPATALAAVHAQLVRDNVNHKMSGACFNRLSMTFPLDGEGTAEVELAGLYAAHFATAAPAATFTGLSSDVMALRDGEMFIDGSGTAIPNLQGFEFSYTNNVNPKWYAKRNVVTQTIGTPSTARKVWFPEENRIGPAQDVTYAINVGDTDATQELAADFAQAQKFVFDVTGGPLGTTPAASELLRVTIYAGVHTGGGPDALVARDDINSRYEGSAFYSVADADDVKIEVVNATSTAIT